MVARVVPNGPNPVRKQALRPLTLGSSALHSLHSCCSAKKEDYSGLRSFQTLRRVRCEGGNCKAAVVEEAFAPLAEYAKTTICSDHIEENSALKKVVNPLEGVNNDQVAHADMKLCVDAVVKPNPLRPHQQLKDLKTPVNMRKF